MFNKDEFLNLHWRCLHWLYIWAMVGADVKNGDWAMLGTRAAVYKTMCTDWDYVNVLDFEFLMIYGKVNFPSVEDVTNRTKDYGMKLINELQLFTDSEILYGASKFKTIFALQSDSC